MLLDRTHSFYSAYMLVAHGSKDFRPQWAMQKLASQVRTLLTSQNAQIIGRMKSNYMNKFNNLP